MRVALQGFLVALRSHEAQGPRVGLHGLCAHVTVRGEVGARLFVLLPLHGSSLVSRALLRLCRLVAAGDAGTRANHRAAQNCRRRTYRHGVKSLFQ